MLADADVDASQRRDPETVVQGGRVVVLQASGSLVPLRTPGHAGTASGARRSCRVTAVDAKPTVGRQVVA